MNEALGLLEVYGLTNAIAVADAMAKAAPVSLLQRHDVGDGLVTVVSSGGVSDVLEAVAAGRRFAESHNAFRSAAVLGRPAPGVADLFFPPGKGDAAPSGAVRPHVAVNPSRARRVRPAQTKT